MLLLWVWSNIPHIPCKNELCQQQSCLSWAACCTRVRREQGAQDQETELHPGAFYVTLAERLVKGSSISSASPSPPPRTLPFPGDKLNSLELLQLCGIRNTGRHMDGTAAVGDLFVCRFGAGIA